MRNSKKTAIILGASGLVGSLVLKQLLEDDRYEKINIYLRKKLDFNHEKLEQHICDLQNLSVLEKLIDGDEAYCCIGTTKKKTPNKQEYKNIDCLIPTNLAKACKSKNISNLFVISAMGANKNSLFFYNRVKAEMEEKVKNVKVENTFFFRPSLLKGNRKEKRILENFSTFIFDLFPKSYRAIEAKIVSNSMIKVANKGFSKNIISNEDMFYLAGDK